MPAAIRKASSVAGAHTLLRDAEVGDAGFIHALRTDAQKSRFLSDTPADVALQADWLRRYQTRTGEAYFIICDKAMQRLGCVRLYDAEGDSYSWGSWLMVSGLAPLVSIESVMLVYAYGKYLVSGKPALPCARTTASSGAFTRSFFPPSVWARRRWTIAMWSASL